MNNQFNFFKKMEEENPKLIGVQAVFKEFSGETDSILLDIRSREEYDAEHITKSTHLPLEEVESRIEEVVPDKEKTIYVFCRSGGRSSMAQSILEEKGYQNVKNIVGGILSWKDQGLPIEK